MKPVEACPGDKPVDGHPHDECEVRIVILELARPLSFLLSLLSLYPVLLSAFFVPGTRWEERLETALLRAALAGCVCFASGMLYAWPAPAGGHERLMQTLPVRVFLWAVAGMTVLFMLSWYLDTYYVPIARRDCCRF
jgi:hypothetical protein